MRKIEKNLRICPVETCLSILGGKYKSLIIWHLYQQTLRFGQLQKIIAQASPKMLTKQLRELEEKNIVHRKVYPIVPPKVEYSLTDFGKSLMPVLFAMFDWGLSYCQEKGLTITCLMDRDRFNTE